MPMLERAFSIADGPFQRLLRRAHLSRPILLVAIAWVPLFVGAVLEHSPLLYDFSVHARLLFAIPLIIGADRMLEARCAAAVGQLYRGRFASRSRVELIIDRAEQLRDSPIPDLVIAFVVVTAGQLLVWGLGNRTGLFTGGETATGVSFARIWYATVGLPIVQFLYLDWLWQWAIWTYVLVSVARLPLATIATHPDEAGGIGFLAEPLSAFATFVVAVSVITAAAWATQIVEHGASPTDFTTRFVVLLVAALVIGCGPLCLYSGKLYRARFRDGRAYNELALDFVRGFHRNWVETAREAEDLQGSAEVRTLNEMIEAVSHVDRVRLVPFRLRAVAVIALAAIAPMIPLAAMTVPPDELVKKLGDALLAGLPV